MKRTLVGIAVAAGLAALAPQAALAQGEPPVADVRVSLTDAPDPVTVGDQITYRLNVKNRGLFDAPRTFAEDRLAGNVELVSAIPSEGSGETHRCDTDPENARLIECNLGLLKNGESESIVIVVDTTTTGRVPNKASVFADVIDLNTANDTDSEGTTVLRPCDGRDVTIAGSNRDETIEGTPQDDVIASFGGADTVKGNGGDDVICAGAGADLVRGKGSNDRLFGQDGTDSLFGGIADDFHNGGSGRDQCAGGPGRNTFVNCEQ